MDRIASEVTDILVGQIRDAMSRLVRAAIEVVGGRGAKSKIVVMSADSVKFVIEFEVEDLQIGATVRYDIGSDTYRLSPFVKRWNMQFNGAISTDFYVEDFSDVTKMKWIFERVMRMLPERGPGMEAREAKIVARIVQADYSGQELVSGRMERVEAILGAIRRIPGVAGVVVNDRTRTADSVDFYVSLKVRERFMSGWPYGSRVKEFEADLNQIRRAVMAALRADRNMGIQGFNMPKKLYRTTQIRYQRETYFIGYNQEDIVVDIWIR